jgi:radical SAM superfamily enzyme YgiQ (UPF0313 family)
MSIIYRNKWLYGDGKWPTQKAVQISSEGLLSIGRYLADHDHHVHYFFPKIEDNTMSGGLQQYLDVLRDYISHHEIKIVGAGPVTFNYHVAQIFMREVKRLSPDTCTILGGHHATFLPEYVLRESPFIDVVARHEGETQMLALCEDNPRSEIAGISYRDGSRICHNPDAPLLNGDDIPSQALSLVPSWVFQHKILLNLGVGRGCPFRCFFCTDRIFWKGKTRFKKVENVIDEITATIEDFNMTQVRFTDDTFTLKSDMIIKLAQRLKEEGKMLKEAQVWTRIDRISDEILNALKLIAEKVEICLGVESGSPAVLCKMNKQITPRQILDGFKKVKKQKMITRAFWIIGHPDSNLEREKESLSLLDTLIKEDLCYLHETAIFQPYPGSEVFNNPKKHGVVIDSFHWPNYIENPPVFPPVSHLKEFSPFEIAQTHYTFRIHILEGFARKLGYSIEDLTEL